jgi:hypothetical protein
LSGKLRARIKINKVAAPIAKRKSAVQKPPITGAMMRMNKKEQPQMAASRMKRKSALLVMSSLNIVM